MKNYVTNIFWSYINAGKGRFYVEDPQVPFINGFSLLLFFTITPFGIYRLLAGDINVAVIDLAIVTILVLNVIYLRLSLRSDVSTFVLALSVAGLATHVFYEGGIGGNTGIFWMYPVPVLMFFILGKFRGALLSGVFFVAVGIVAVLGAQGVFTLPYTQTMIIQAFLTLAVLTLGVFLYSDFTARNAQELEERTKSLREGFESEKMSIKEESKQKEEALKTELDTFFRTTNQLMGIASPEGKFTQVNPAFAKILGYTEKEIIEKPFMSLVHPDDVVKTQEVVSGLSKKIPVANFINRYARKDGSFAWLMWNATFSDGLIYATAQPVDDLVEAQKKTEEKMKEVEDLNRLMVGREVRMAELKEEIEALKKGQGIQSEQAHI